MLKLENISYKINDNNKIKTILNNVNYEFEEGKIYVINGVSGSGKTTLLYSIAGLISNIEGNILFDKNDLCNLKNHNERDNFRLNNISMIFQNLNLFSFLNVEDNILMPFYAKKIKVDFKVKKEVSDYLKLMNLEGFEKKTINQLSGGEQQRVAIIRAIIQKSKVILCDEPTANLDSENTEIFMSNLLKIKDNLKSIIIISTHDSRLANYADVNIMLKDGKIV